MIIAETASALRIEPVDRLEALEAGWRRLGESTCSVFDTWEWTSLWLAHFGRGRELALAAGLDEADEVAAVLPIYVWRSRPGRVLRFLGHGLSDHMGPICRPDARPAAGAALAAYLRGRRDWDVLLAENLPGGTGWAGALGGRVLRTESNPVLEGGDGWDAFLASRTSHFRKQLAKRVRVLHRDHDVRYRLADDPDRLERDLDLLFALHDARWSGAATAFGGAREPFHRAFAAEALRRGWLRLWFLEADGAPVATMYGFRLGGVECCYQAGRDPEWDRSSVGFVLFAHAIRTALEEGVDEYRFLRGDDPWKERFATRDDGLATVACASGARGRALVAAAGALRASSRARKALRAPLEA